MFFYFGINELYYDQYDRWLLRYIIKFLCVFVISEEVTLEDLLIIEESTLAAIVTEYWSKCCVIAVNANRCCCECK